MNYRISRILSVIFIISGLCILNSCGGLLQQHTEISNIIGQDMVLAKQQSPYLIRGDVTIPENVTVTVEPGVVLDFSGNNKITVEGTFKAIGTESDPIIYKQYGKYYISGWYGLVFKSKKANDSSIVKYGNICQARFAIYCDGGSPQISYCTITANEIGIHLWNSNAVVSHNKISGNAQHGLYIGSLSPTISNNVITQNNRGIVCDFAPTPNIQQNDVFGNTEYDFYVMRTENDIQAPNNWWGSTNEPAIRQKIFDKQKDGSVGNVYINPIAVKPFTQ
ncbi:MAG: right-handed parallel beta-helix repeat-containing protein [bacterium]